MSTVVSKEKLVITEHGQYKVCIRAKRLLAEQNNLWDTCNPDLPVEKLRAIVKPEFPGPHAFKRSIVYVEVPVAEGAPLCKAQALVFRELLCSLISPRTRLMT
jgi:hypothetical protein